MGRLWQNWCQGVLQPSQKTIWLVFGECPRPQFMQTAASPGFLRFLGRWVEEGWGAEVGVLFDGLRVEEVASMRIGE